MRKSYLALLTTISLLIIASSLEAKQIRIGVAEFVNKTSTMSLSKTDIRATEVFSKILSASSATIEVLGSKSLEAFSAMTAENAVKAGKTGGCDYVLLGAVMQLNGKASTSQGGLLNMSITKVSMVETVTLDTRIVEVETGKVILSASGTGISSYSYDPRKFSGKNSQENADKFTKMSFDAHDQALSSASSMVAEKICAFLVGEYPEVSSVIKPQNVGKTKKKGKNNPASVKINRGTSSGVYTGSMYRIYFDGDEVFDFNGKSLGHEKITVAVAEVKEAKGNYCTAEIMGGVLDNIHEGDKAEQVTREEAQYILEKNEFSRSRLSEFLR